MSKLGDTSEIEGLRRRVAELEAELARLRPLEAAAREAHAFFAGRRPGFAPSYPRDVLAGAIEPGKQRQPRTRAGTRKR